MNKTICAAALLVFACQGSGELDAPLRRDLQTYFGGAAVKYELLRRGPTQAGIAWPKYYAWVHVAKPGAPAQEGVVRVAYIDCKRFEVTHFLSAAEIRASPARVDAIFPPPLCPKIKRRAGAI